MSDDAIEVIKKPEFHTAGFPRASYQIVREYFNDWVWPGHVFNYESRYVRLSPSNPEWSLKTLRPFFTYQPCEFTVDDSTVQYDVDHTTVTDTVIDLKNYTMIGVFLRSVNNEMNDSGVSITVGMRANSKIVSALNATNPEDEPCSVYVPLHTREVFSNEGILCTHWTRTLNIYADDYDEVVSSLRKGIDLQAAGIDIKPDKTRFTNTEEYVITSTATTRPAVKSLSKFIATYDDEEVVIYDETANDLIATFTRMCRNMNDEDEVVIFSTKNPKPFWVANGVRSMTENEFKVLKMLKYQYKVDSHLFKIVNNYWESVASQEMPEMKPESIVRDQSGKFATSPVFLVERAIQKFSSDSESIKWVRAMHDPANVTISAKFDRSTKPNAAIGTSGAIDLQINLIYVPNRVSAPPEVPEESVAPVLGAWFKSLPFSVPR